jgi:hypothetical protein
VDIGQVETGLIMYNSIAVPVQNGQIQMQHASTIPSDAGLLTVCGFLPRASQVDVSPADEERPIDTERRAALDHVLVLIANVTAERLVSAEFAGTPPARIYRSFVSPRPDAVHILETVERAAKRTANQIELGVRQVLADRAVYLRNTDKISLSVSQGERVLNPVAIVLDNIRSAL